MDWEPGEVYDDGDVVVAKPMRVVKKTGLAWLKAKITGQPTVILVEGEPVKYRCIRRA